MISYYGRFDSRYGRATFLGQDAVIVPTPAVKAPPPDPEPAGPQPGPSMVTPVPTPSEPTVSIGGHPVSIVALTLAGLISLGAIALVVSTTSSMKSR
jgi:hypothetical protein